MVGDLLQPTHLLFVLAVALLVLGPKRLPEVGRMLGRGLRDFRTAISGEEIPERTMPTPPVPPASAQPAPASNHPSATTEQPSAAPDETAPTEVRAPSETAEPVTTSAGTDSPS